MTQNNPGPHLWPLYWFVVALLTLMVVLPVYGDEPDYSDPAPVEEYIKWFHRLSKLNRYVKALEAIPYVMQHSATYKMDPLLVACIISLESSWRPRLGALDEVGYMQVMPGKWSRQFDLTTPSGQIEAGVYRLRMAFDKCGSLERALTHYGSGRCHSKSERTQKKMKYRKNYYTRMHRKFRGGR